MAKRSPLDEPANSAHAWARYRRLMRWMALFTAAVVAFVLGFLRWQEGPAPINFYIATGLGIGATMMLMGALMGLVFLSSGTGHDEAVSDFEED
jgi:phosphate/sulfate permease